MKREIKFRVWDKDSKIMKYDIHIISIAYDTYLQFTGLKDKNGKEIYEGDIVKKRDRIIEVYYSNEWGYNSDISIDNGDSLIYYEIIGNIYENKELLK